MADRSGRHIPTTAATTTAPPSSSLTTSTSSSSSSALHAHAHPRGGAAASRRPGVSRNLFKSQLTRRPTAPTAPGAGGRSATAAGMSGAGDPAAMSNAASSASASSSTNNSSDALRLADVDIHGASVGGGSESYDFVVRDMHGEIEIGDFPMPGVLDEAEEGVILDQEESKKERQRLADAVKQHRINHPAMPDQPEELLEAVRRSLKTKVAALEEDHWMFESGDPTSRR